MVCSPPVVLSLSGGGGVGLLGRSFGDEAAQGGAEQVTGGDDAEHLGGAAGDGEAGDLVLEHGGGGELDGGLVVDGDHVVAGGAVDGAAERFIVTTLGGVAIRVRADGLEYVAVREDGDDAAAILDEQVVDAVRAHGIARIAEIRVGEDADGRSGHDVADGGSDGLVVEHGSAVPRRAAAVGPLSIDHRHEFGNRAGGWK